MILETHWREEDGVRLPATLWRAGDGLRTISSALLGGGIGAAGWVLNAQVPGGYARTDPLAHLGEIAAPLGLRGPGVGMLTAAAVERTFRGADGGVHVSATVGLRVPTWAAAPEGAADPELAPMLLDAPYRPGTINITVAVPVALADAALVNAVVTATEAKAQALLEAGYAATGTASDAICVAAPDAGPAEAFAGPRSVWGARIARAVHAAVLAGARDYTALLAARRAGR
ncbi:adenosylcobinamide amidohydrolase [Actinomadura parmotrematis]|uniref:adenosylcobinamide amidohydrolase n=1 Tax=Actinomadura parmotrematis TaxID=2864039 RepID=UPI0035584032